MYTLARPKTALADNVRAVNSCLAEDMSGSSGFARANAGRLAPYLGIVLVSFGLLTSVTSFSPLAAQIADSIHLTPLTYGLLGMLAPVILGIMGFVTPAVARRLSLEGTILLAAVFIALGQLLRSFAGEAMGFFAWSIVATLGIGAANMLLPALIKRFFPDRVVGVSTVYSVLLVASSIYPPLFAVPLAQAFGWRVSIGVWFLIEAIAVIPWLLVAVRAKRSLEERPIAHIPAGLNRRVWRSRTSWALVGGYATATFNFYIMVAWLPTLLGETGHTSPAMGGTLLSLYSVVGIATGLLIPRMLHQVENIGSIFTGISVLTAVGYLGLLAAPGTLTWVWVVLAGVAPSFFTTVLVGLNYRSRTDFGVVALGGMVTACGYLLGATGSLIVGALRSAGAPWSVTLFMLLASLLVPVISGLGLRRRIDVDA